MQSQHRGGRKTLSLPGGKLQPLFKNHSRIERYINYNYLLVINLTKYSCIIGSAIIYNYKYLVANDNNNSNTCTCHFSGTQNRLGGQSGM